MDIQKSLTEQRRNMVLVTKQAKQGHLSCCFSVLELLNVLYKKIMRFDIQNPDSDKNDICILSKGHAALALYALYYDMGIFSKETFFSFSQYDSILGEHPDRNKIKGVKVSTGSLGHGLPCGAGIALAQKIQNKNNKVFVIIGDGEANEGSVWESALIADRYNLDNLTCIVDNNHSESYSPDLLKKFEAFGWQTLETDMDKGNNLQTIENALRTEHLKPLAIILNTKKGYGSELMMKEPEKWHHHTPTDEEFETLMEELS